LCLVLVVLYFLHSFICPFAIYANLFNQYASIYLSQSSQYQVNPWAWIAQKILTLIIEFPRAEVFVDNLRHRQLSFLRQSRLGQGLPHPHSMGR
jgi:hypothetical protein